MQSRGSELGSVGLAETQVFFVWPHGNFQILLRFICFDTCTNLVWPQTLSFFFVSFIRDTNLSELLSFYILQSVG